MWTLITLTATEEVTGDRMCGNLCQRSRKTYRAASHRHGTTATYVCYLVTAIGVGQDVTTGNPHLGIMFYPTCRRTPVVAAAVFLLIRHIARTASEYNSYPRLTVGRMIRIGRGEF